MNACKFSQELLQAWFDGEAGDWSGEVEEHLEDCTICKQTIAEWETGRDSLRSLIDDAVGEADTLRALQGIRARIENNKKESIFSLFSRFWDELWSSHRAAIAGVMVAAAMGALVSPVVIWLMARTYNQDVMVERIAAVVIESLEVSDETKAVVFEREGSSTTWIWVEPLADETDNGNQTF
ncbi:hypothetical protein KAI87_11300 [Myxococcota bacterium]|nr:hypothetical protein [Myxococcota bacterium]